METSRSLCTRY